METECRVISKNKGKSEEIQGISVRPFLGGLVSKLQTVHFLKIDFNDSSNVKSISPVQTAY